MSSKRCKAGRKSKPVVSGSYTSYAVVTLLLTSNTRFETSLYSTVSQHGYQYQWFVTSSRVTFWIQRRRKPGEVW